VKLQIRESRPIVDGVYVNGRGPYRFLIDTGTNVNLIETRLARKIGMSASFQIELVSASGRIQASGSDGNEVSLDSAKANGQKFLFSDLDAIHDDSPDVMGVLGEWFLSQFDYTLDMEHQQLRFGKEAPQGTLTQFQIINARPVVSTSLGILALDSGNNHLVLFGTLGDLSTGSGYALRSVSGSRAVGNVSGRPLIIQGRTFWNGDAVAISDRPEPGVDGLMPLSLFQAIYVCNSGGYMILR
jgi:hypothetical protein